MSDFWKKGALALVFGVCIWGGINHWRSSHPSSPQPQTPAPTALVIPAAGVKVVPPETATVPIPTPTAQPRLNVNVTIQRIYDLEKSKSFQEALGLANSLVTELEPHARDRSDDLGYAYLARGEVYEELDRVDDAIGNFEHAYYLWRDDTPDSGRGWLRAYDALTRSFTKAQRWGEAIAMADRGLKTAAATPAGDSSYEIRFHQRKIEALLALDRKRDAEATADVFRQRIPVLLGNDATLRTRWLGWLAECYRKLGLAEKQLAVRADAANGLPDDTGQPTTLAEFERRLSLANAALAAGNKADANRRADALRSALPGLTSPEDSIEAMIKLYGFYDDADRYDDGLALAQVVADFQGKANQPDPTAQRKNLRWVKKFLSNLCHFDEAAATTNRILELDRSVFGENSAEYIRDLNSRAHDLFFTGDSKAALACARDALARAERLQPLDEPLIESCLGLLGFVITQSSEAPATEAETALRRAIDLNEKRKGKFDLNSAGDRVNLATALMEQNRLDDAQSVLENAIACYKANNALDSDSAGWAYCQQSSLYEMKKEWDKALVAARQAVEIRERIYGLQNFRTRIMLRQFVNVAWQAGDRQACIDRAEQLLISERADHGWTIFRDLLLCARLAGWQAEMDNSKRAQELGALLESASREYYSKHRAN
jgi:tetratricopeptide (TPR) repeat protein